MKKYSLLIIFFFTFTLQGSLANFKTSLTNKFNLENRCKIRYGGQAVLGATLLLGSFIKLGSMYHNIKVHNFYAWYDLPLTLLYAGIGTNIIEVSIQRIKGKNIRPNEYYKEFIGPKRHPYHAASLSGFICDFSTCAIMLLGLGTFSHYSQVHPS